MCGVEQVKYQIPGATGISLQLQMITLLGDAAAAGFTINLFNAQPIMSWPEPGCMALAMVLMKNTLMRIAVLSANCQSGVWKSAFSAQLYKCPLNRYTPPADWASYGCLGQISAVSTCSNVSYRNADVTLACTPIN